MLKRPFVVSAFTQVRPGSDTIALVFYRIYNEDGGVPSEVPVDSKHPYLACIDGHLVAPPHTVASIKRCICKVEKIPNKDQDVQLFGSASETTPMNDDEHLAVLEGTGPGSSPKLSLALVCKLEDVPVGKFKVKLKAIVPWGEHL
jgi:hypothetical protein